MKSLSRSCFVLLLLLLLLTHLHCLSFLFFFFFISPSPGPFHSSSPSFSPSLSFLIPPSHSHAFSFPLSFDPWGPMDGWISSHPIENAEPTSTNRGHPITSAYTYSHKKSTSNWFGNRDVQMIRTTMIGAFSYLFSFQFSFSFPFPSPFSFSSSFGVIFASAQSLAIGSSIDVMPNHVWCAINSEKGVSCFGDELNQNYTDSFNHPLSLPLHPPYDLYNVTALSTSSGGGSLMICAIRDDNTFICWGSLACPFDIRHKPCISLPPLPSNTKVESITCGINLCCVIELGGNEMSCFGFQMKSKNLMDAMEKYGGGEVRVTETGSKRFSFCVAICQCDTDCLCMPDTETDLDDPWNPSSSSFSSSSDSSSSPFFPGFRVNSSIGLSSLRSKALSQGVTVKRINEFVCPVSILSVSLSAQPNLYDNQIVLLIRAGEWSTHSIIFSRLRHSYASHDYQFAPILVMQAMPIVMEDVFYRVPVVDFNGTQSIDSYASDYYGSIFFSSTPGLFGPFTTRSLVRTDPNVDLAIRYGVASYGCISADLYPAALNSTMNPPGAYGNVAFPRSTFGPLSPYSSIDPLVPSIRVLTPAMLVPSIISVSCGYGCSFLLSDLSVASSSPFESYFSVNAMITGSEPLTRTSIHSSTLTNRFISISCAASHCHALNIDGEMSCYGDLERCQRWDLQRQNSVRWITVFSPLMTSVLRDQNDLEYPLGRTIQVVAGGSAFCVIQQRMGDLKHLIGCIGGSEANLCDGYRSSMGTMSRNPIPDLSFLTVHDNPGSFGSFGWEKNAITIHQSTRALAILYADQRVRMINPFVRSFVECNSLSMLVPFQFTSSSLDGNQSDTGTDMGDLTLDPISPIRPWTVFTQARFSTFTFGPISPASVITPFCGLLIPQEEDEIYSPNSRRLGWDTLFCQLSTGNEFEPTIRLFKWLGVYTFPTPLLITATVHKLDYSHLALKYRQKIFMARTFGIVLYFPIEHHHHSDRSNSSSFCDSQSTSNSNFSSSSSTSSNSSSSSSPSSCTSNSNASAVLPSYLVWFGSSFSPFYLSALSLPFPPLYLSTECWSNPRSQCWILTEDVIIYIDQHHRLRSINLWKFFNVTNQNHETNFNHTTTHQRNDENDNGFGGYNNDPHDNDGDDNDNDNDDNDADDDAQQQQQHRDSDFHWPGDNPSESIVVVPSHLEFYKDQSGVLHHWHYTSLSASNDVFDVKPGQVMTGIGFACASRRPQPNTSVSIEEDSPRNSSLSPSLLLFTRSSLLSCWFLPRTDRLKPFRLEGELLISAAKSNNENKTLNAREQRIRGRPEKLKEFGWKTSGSINTNNSDPVSPITTVQEFFFRLFNPPNSDWLESIKPFAADLHRNSHQHPIVVQPMNDSSSSSSSLSSLLSSSSSSLVINREIESVFVASFVGTQDGKVSTESKVCFISRTEMETETRSISRSLFCTSSIISSDHSSGSFRFDEVHESDLDIEFQSADLHNGGCLLMKINRTISAFTCASDIETSLDIIREQNRYIFIVPFIASADQLSPQFYFKRGSQMERCSPGSFSTGLGAITPFCSGVCDAGRYTNTRFNETTSQCQFECEAGRYCTPGSIEPQECPPGRFGHRTSTSILCTDLCAPGCFCLAGSTSPTENQLPAGRYSSAYGVESSINSFICPAGYFCSSGSVDYRYSLCAVGFYCPAAATSLTPMFPGQQCDSYVTDPDDSDTVYITYSSHFIAQRSGCIRPRFCRLGFECNSGFGRMCASGFVCPMPSMDTRMEKRAASSPPVRPIGVGFYCNASLVFGLEVSIDLGDNSFTLQADPYFYSSSFNANFTVVNRTSLSLFDDSPCVQVWNNVALLSLCSADSTWFPYLTMKITESNILSEYWNWDENVEYVLGCVSVDICPSGYRCSGNGRRVICEPGSYSDNGAAVCLPCPAGTFTVSNGSSSCIPCQPGTVQSQIHSTKCHICPSGSYAPTSGMSSCITCDLLVNEDGTECRPSRCPPGRYQRVNGSQADCFDCEIGYYSETQGASSCLQCSVLTYSFQRGSSHCFDCTSQAGLDCDSGVASALPGYWAFVDVSGMNVRLSTSPCPPNLCTGFNSRNTPVVLDIEILTYTGFRPGDDDESSLDSIDGINAIASPKSMDPFEKSALFDMKSFASLTFNLPAFIPQCAPHRINSTSNRLCGACEMDYTEWRGSCVQCSETRWDLIFFLFVLSSIYLLMVYHKSHDAEGTTKIFFFFVQTAVLQLGSYSSWLSWLGFFNFQPDQATGDFCLLPLTRYQTLALPAIVPFLVVVQLCLFGLLHFSSYVIKSWRIEQKFHSELEIKLDANNNQQRYRPLESTLSQPDSSSNGTGINNQQQSAITSSCSSIFSSCSRWFLSFSLLPHLSSAWYLMPTARYTSALLSVYLQTYYSVSLVTLRFLHCVEVANEMIVFTNPSVNCNSSTYLAWRPFMIFLLVVHVGSAPGFLALFLYRNRQRVLRRKLDKDFFSRYGTLFGCYSDDSYCFQSLVLFRQFLLVGIDVIFATDLNKKSLLFSICNLFNLVLHLLRYPYRNMMDNHAASISFVSLTLITLLLQSHFTSTFASIARLTPPFQIAICILIVPFAAYLLIVISIRFARRMRIRIGKVKETLAPTFTAVFQMTTKWKSQIDLQPNPNLSPSQSNSNTRTEHSNHTNSNFGAIDPPSPSYPHRGPTCSSSPIAVSDSLDGTIHIPAHATLFTAPASLYISSSSSPSSFPSNFASFSSSPSSLSSFPSVVYDRIEHADNSSPHGQRNIHTHGNETGEKNHNENEDGSGHYNVSISTGSNMTPPIPTSDLSSDHSSSQIEIETKSDHDGS